MSSLLEEAIVDAKALKEAALKNAEDAVLEKYSGEIKKALDTLLEQEDPLQGLGEEPSSDEELTGFIDEVPYAFQGEEIDAPNQDEVVEINFDDLKTRIEADGAAADGSDLTDALGMADELSLGDEMPLDDEAPLDDELALEEGNAMEDTESQMMSDNAEEASAGLAGSAAKEELEEEIDLSEEMISDLIEELIVDMTPRPEGWSSVNSADNSVVQANNDAMADAQAAHSEEEEVEYEEETAPDVVSDAALYETKISELTHYNKGLRALVKEAKSQLTKLNLANAKLVYQNKALNSSSLNERQKNQIAEAVQTANSVEETAMIFETIQNAVGSTPNQRTRPQTLREAVQRPTSLLMNSKRDNTVTSDPKMDRMLRLAGLNNK